MTADYLKMAAHVAGTGVGTVVSFYIGWAVLWPARKLWKHLREKTNG